MFRPIPAKAPNCTSGSPRTVFNVICTDTPMAGQRHFKTAAQTGAVNSGDDRNRQRLDLRHKLLSLTRQRFRFLRALAAAYHVDIGASNKVICFGRDKKQRPATLYFRGSASRMAARLRGKLRFQGYLPFPLGHPIETTATLSRRTLSVKADVVIIPASRTISRRQDRQPHRPLPGQNRRPDA
ncbi:Uncharacterised protein [Salmonella enterica subsp. arizonae]|uniref:Uncharacterized protein n=1 Tax=Salmonella enterica subsp. arizonae TaxID=59203 RepID=A0A379SLU0_SALER|nr:Uncharacterised protein [Salmonella enterica subsp. arizonae]